MNGCPRQNPAYRLTPYFTLISPMGAPPGALGAMRSLIHLRQLLITLGVRLVPMQVTVLRAHEAFDAAAALKDPKINQQISQLIQQLVNRLR
jgi:chromate reductase, NAD(P)H dehydrogenase (quinone)